MTQLNQEKEEAMSKRFVFIGVLCFSMMALFQTQALAWTYCNAGKCSSGVSWSSYTLIFEIKGGGSNDSMDGTFATSTLQVTKASLVCSNPGTNKKDVRGGIGGITIAVDIPVSSLTPIDDRGRFLIKSEKIYAERDELPIDQYPTVEDRQVFFNDFWQVDSSDCKSDQWDPYAYLIQSATLTGILTTDGNVIDKTTLNCTTQEDPRTWADDGEVTYTCSVLK